MSKPVKNGVTGMGFDKAGLEFLLWEREKIIFHCISKDRFDLTMQRTLFLFSHYSDESDNYVGVELGCCSGHHAELRSLSTV